MTEIRVTTTEIRVIGGPTAVIEFGGLRFLTDPTFDEPGDFPRGDGRFLTKTAPASAGPDDIGPIDVVLLSHDTHPDNLDDAGRAFLPRAGVVYTTPGGGERLGGNAIGLRPWETVSLANDVVLTAVPARHGPEGCEPVTGEVAGFVLTAPSAGTVYVSGDNASLDVVRAVAERFPGIGTAVLFLGAARVGLFDNALLTLDSAGAVEASRILGAARVVPVHCDSWAHFTESRADVEKAFAAAGLTERLSA